MIDCFKSSGRPDVLYSVTSRVLSLGSRLIESKVGIVRHGDVMEATRGKAERKRSKRSKTRRRLARAQAGRPGPNKFVARRES